jgi:hypothetical protein
MQSNQMPLALRLAGCWLLWSAWCSVTGWSLSAVNQLSGWGHLALLPFLLASIWFWLKATASTRNDFSHIAKWRRRLCQPLPLIYLTVAGLSLVAGAINANPWSFDAVTYRLPRVLYWWSEHHWYWIGTLDHRLDYSATGFEWQMLPLIELTHSDRFIFLLNWIPLLLMPWLVFLAFRAFGINGRSARRWMWLLPTGFCYALQSSGLQNDGYSVNYVLAAIGFAAYAYHSRRTIGLCLAILSIALLTSAKLSNLPLLLPLGFILWPVFFRVRWFNWRLFQVVLLAGACSFLPLAYLCWQQTGDWTGDPGDQWNMRPVQPTGAVVANLIEFANDALHPPILPGSQRVNTLIDPLNHTAFIAWLERTQLNFTGIKFGEMAYEGGVGLGCGVGLYTLFLLLGFGFAKSSNHVAALIPTAWRLALWLSLVSFVVLLAKLGSGHTARNAATYYPLLYIFLLRWPRLAALERRPLAGVFSGVAALAVVPVILLTPARPLVPVEQLAHVFPRPTLQKIAARYHTWDVMRDDLAPMREQLPPGTRRLGFAAGFRDTPYGLCKPLGQRVMVELGLPLGTKTLPPADLEYAVITARGLRERYEMNLPAWLAFARAEIIFELKRNTSLTGSDSAFEPWYLVKFRR